MRMLYCLGTLILATLLALCLGDSYLNPGQAITGALGISDSYTNLIVQTLRLPRILLALVAGAAFGLAGCLLQTLTRNPLASPDVIGLSQMANVGALVFLVLFSTAGGTLWFPVYYQPVPAIIGALLAGSTLYLLSMRKTVDIYRFILIGIGINALAQSFVTLLIMLTNKRAAQAQVWITGSVHNAEYYQVGILSLIVGLITLIVLYNQRNYEVYKLGRDSSVGLGSPYGRVAILTLLLISILLGFAVSFVGGIQFVGLIAPQIAARLVGMKFNRQLIASSLIGSTLVIISDLLGRTLFLPLEIPAGVFTASIGAPFFMYLIFKRRQLKS
ncbi:FecCD family ABC transporter permease [Macrococcus carouselicus]|uniref:Iron ABC transporter permease n=1 Tax=Macrococcus carouselicus TaxID=69969 RepID=A0A9Q8CGX6_9STAP|nr:iron ABC transporter permease [Macrococcus carouselicus]TDM02414.1 iron ABC transporter permease [Macrococcus carouselicus]